MAETLYIELIGLPGNGKTVAGYRLEQHLANSALNVALRKPLSSPLSVKLAIIFRILGLVITKPSTLKLWFILMNSKYQHVTNAKFAYHKVRNRFFIEVAVIDYLFKQGLDILINDEGVIGKVCVFCLLSGHDERFAVKILTAVLPRNLIIINVEADTQIALRRKQERNIELPFFDDMSSEIREHFYTENQLFYKNVCELLAQTKNIRGLAVPNNGNIGVLNSALAKIAKSIIAAIN